MCQQLGKARRIKKAALQNNSRGAVPAVWKVWFYKMRFVLQSFLVALLLSWTRDPLHTATGSQERERQCVTKLAGIFSDHRTIFTTTFGGIILFQSCSLQHQSDYFMVFLVFEFMILFSFEDSFVFEPHCLCFGVLLPYQLIISLVAYYESLVFWVIFGLGFCVGVWLNFNFLFVFVCVCHPQFSHLSLSPCLLFSLSFCLPAFFGYFLILP